MWARADKGNIREYMGGRGGGRRGGKGFIKGWGWGEFRLGVKKLWDFLDFLDFLGFEKDEKILKPWFRIIYHIILLIMLIYWHK